VPRNARRPGTASASCAVRLLATLAAVSLATAGCRDGALNARADARRFATADDAAWALLTACADRDVGRVLGADERESVVRAGLDDPTEVARLGASGLLLEYATEDRVFLRLGPGAHRFPVPLVRERAGWRFRSASHPASTASAALR